MTSFQSSELTELPVVENSQLFAQRAQRTVRPHTLIRVSNGVRHDPPKKKTRCALFGMSPFLESGDCQPPLGLVGMGEGRGGVGPVAGSGEEQ